MSTTIHVPGVFVWTLNYSSELGRQLSGFLAGARCVLVDVNENLTCKGRTGSEDDHFLLVLKLQMTLLASKRFAFCICSSFS